MFEDTLEGGETDERRINQENCMASAYFAWRCSGDFRSTGTDYAAYGIVRVEHHNDFGN